MGFYLLIAVILWFFALLRVDDGPSRRFVEILPLFIFIFLAGLRFETGYDWVVYQDFYDQAPTFGEYIINPFDSDGVKMELLFTLLVVVSKTLGLGLSFVFFTSAVFNTICFYSFARFFRINFVSFAAAYFCWLYLPVQMGVLRQSLSLSFLMLTIQFFCSQKYLKSAVLFVLGLGFHSSLLMFAPLFFTKFTPFLRRTSITIVGVLAVLYFLNFDLVYLFFSLGQKLGGDLIAEKLALYAAIQPSAKSLGGLLYFIFNLGAFYYLSRISKDSVGDSILLNAVLLLVIAQALFPSFPLLWNRVQYFALPAQVILWLRGRERSQTLKGLESVAVASISLFVLVYQLRNPLMRPYTPYVSLLSRDFESDGWERTSDYYRDTEIVFDKAVEAKLKKNRKRKE